jgi:hypothetical protein
MNELLAVKKIRIYRGWWNETISHERRHFSREIIEHRASDTRENMDKHAGREARNQMRENERHGIVRRY